MKNIGRAAQITLGVASPVLLLFFAAGVLRAQEIRVVAEPNESIRMGRGGYVCEGQLTHTPIDATENWTYEMVQCTGPIYASNDYAALNEKLSHDELVKLNESLNRLNVTSRNMQVILEKQGEALNGDLKAAIEMRFQDLPHDVLASAAIQNLKKNLIEYVDQRLPRTPVNNLPIPRPSAPARNEPSLPANLP